MNTELETDLSSSISHIVDIKRFSDHYKLLRVTAIILAISKSKPFYMKSIVLTPKREMLKKAEVMGLILIIIFTCINNNNNNRVLWFLETY